MSDTNPGADALAGGDETLSFDDSVDAISDLIADPETDLGEDDQAHEADAEDDEANAAESDEADAETDGTDEGSEEEEDGPGTYEGGKFASDNAKVTLKDGTTISVQDLKRGYMSQQYFTRETQALSEAKQSFEGQRQQVSEFARSLAQQRDFLLQAAQQFLPAPPDRAMIDSDVFGYQHALAEYQEKMGVINQIQQAAAADQARMQAEMEQARQNRVSQEAQKLVEVMPELSKPEAYQKFWTETVETLADFGFTAEEIHESANDHRFYKVFRELNRHRRAQKAAPGVKQDIQKKPVMSAGKRMDPKAKISRGKEANYERLRQTGDFDAGVTALMDLDL